MKDPFPEHKQVCRKLAPPNWAYGGFSDGYYLFISGNATDGYKEMKCHKEDLTQDNLALMALMNLTR